MNPLITLELSLIRDDISAARTWLMKAQARGDDKAKHKHEITRLTWALDGLERVDDLDRKDHDAMHPASQLVTHTDRRA